MGSDDQSLTLGLGLPSSSPKPNNATTNHTNLNPVKQQQPMIFNYEPSLTLSLSGETYHNQIRPTNMMMIKKPEEQQQQQACSVISATSSLSNTTATGVVLSVKRERDQISAASSEDLDTERGSSRATASDDDENGSGPTASTTTTRKKLRLTKDQSALLEESFKLHSTLNPKQKQALAERLNLRPRQVEVWFQNRRARTKLKQTEVDCEYLKKCCATLTDENRRLQKELEELKALKMGQAASFYMQLPAATLTMCPSCERIGAPPAPTVPVVTPSSKTAPLSFTMGPGPGSVPKPHFYAAFPNPSAAC